MKFHKNKFLTTIAAAALVLAVGACSSGSDDNEGLIGERDDALAALAAAKMAAAAAATAAEEAQAAALAAAALAAEAAQMTALAEAATAAAAAQEMALADAATAAEAAKMMALAEAATAAEAAKMMALADAATAAEAAKMMALAEAATAAEAAKMMALAEAATAAEAAKMMALAEAATAAEAAKMMALAEAATAAEEAHAAALATALADAATMADEDQAEALKLAAEAADEAQAMALAAAKTAADEAQAMALAAAKTAADEAQAMALAAAKTAADEAQAMALAAAKTAADEAQAMALAAAKTAADEAQAMALAAAKTAADEAQAMALAAAKTAADAKLMAANDGLVAALEELDLEPASDTMSVEDQIAANTATLKAALASIREDAREALIVAASKERIARAGMVHTAIGVAPGGAAAKAIPTGGDITAVTAKRNAAGMVTVDVNGEDDDAYVGGETDASSGDWNSVTMSKTNVGGESTDMAVVYTDIEAPSDKLFTEEYDSDARNDILDADRVAKAQSDHFPTGKSQSVQFGGDSGNPDSFRGRFDGVPGVFECSTTPCTLTTDGEGKLLTSDNWSFTPDSPNSATIKDPDAAYTYFGWWLNKPKKEDAIHSVEVFAGGVGTDHEATIDDAIEGTATYTGPAAGKYATQTFTAGVQTDAAVGHFTATTHLTAKFGDETGPGEGISGTVTGFQLDDVTSVPWKVNLELATYSGANFTGTTEVDFGGGATATDNGGAGNWQGTFYGPGTEDEDAPSTVVGTFGASTTSASVLGGFGATK